MDGVVADVMHSPAQSRLLPVQQSCGYGTVFRQPGEYRDLRVSHSVRHQDFLSLAVIASGAWIPDGQSKFTLGRITDGSNGRYVSVCIERVNGRGVVAHIGNDQLIILVVDEEAGGVLEAGLGTFQDAGRRDVATIGPGSRQGSSCRWLSADGRQVQLALM